MHKNRTQRQLAGALMLALAIGAPLSYGVDEDSRKLIVLRPKERASLLLDMRSYLRAVQKITLGITQQDHQAVEQEARSLGRIAIYAVKAYQVPGQVPSFRSLAVGVHEGFEQLADNAANEEEPLVLLGQLGRLMSGCIACHDAFKVLDSSH